MLDIKEIVAHRERIEEALRKRLDSVDFSEVISWHAQRKTLKAAVDQKRNERKVLSSQIPALMKKQEDTSEVIAQVKKLAGEISTDEAAYQELEVKIHDFLAYLPNVPEDEVPAGGKENNEPLEYFHDKPAFDFETKDHVDLATSLGLIDFERGTKLGGRGKWVYWGDGALLEWGLLNYFIDHHRKSGYTFILPPHLLRAESGFVAGQFPKFKDDVFYVSSRTEAVDERSHFLLPTSETAIVNLYANEIIPEEKLPLRFFGYSPCYRREAGSYRTAERGTIRGSQFNKVELFALTKPEDSERAFQAILKQATDLMVGLGLHFRVTRLAAQDCSESMAKTYDIEAWIPSIGDYKEVSSVSNSHTFQALRGNIRYKDQGSGKTRFVHTLNGSGLATSRVLPAILEQFQLPDGQVRVPKVLQSYLDKEVFEAPE